MKMDTNCLGGIAEAWSHVSDWWRMLIAFFFFTLIGLSAVRKKKDNEKNKMLLAEYHCFAKIAVNLRELQSEMMVRLAVLFEVSQNDWYLPMSSDDLTLTDKLNLHRKHYRNAVEDYKYGAEVFNEGMMRNNFIFCTTNTLPPGAEETLPREFKLQVVPPQYTPNKTLIPSDA